MAVYPTLDLGWPEDAIGRRLQADRETLTPRECEGVVRIRGSLLLGPVRLARRDRRPQGAVASEVALHIPDAPLHLSAAGIDIGLARLSSSWRAHSLGRGGTSVAAIGHVWPSRWTAEPERSLNYVDPNVSANNLDASRFARLVLVPAVDPGNVN